MIDALRKDAERLRNKHSEYCLRIDEIDLSIKELTREREELRVKAGYTWSGVKHVHKMIERAE